MKIPARFLYSLHRKVIVIFFLLVVASNAFLTAQEAIPDTKVGQRFKQLLETLNEADPVKRGQLIEAIFEDREEKIARVKSITEDLHEDFAGVKFQSLIEASESSLSALCKTGSGSLIEIGMEIIGEENRIGDVSIGPADVEEEALEPVGDLVPIFNDGESKPECRGVWQAKGYGYVLEVTETELNAYNFTGDFGWKLEFVDNLYFQPGESEETARVTFHPLEPGFQLTRLESLPEVCTKTQWSNVELFDSFVDVMDTFYPFFEQRNFDWQARKKLHRPKVNNEMSEEELFDVMAAMIKDLHDGHVSLRAEIDGKSKTADVGDGVTMARLSEAFEKQTEVPSRQSFMRRFFRAQTKNIKSTILKGNFQTACKEKLIWGRVDDRVGYLFIDAMHSFADGGLTDQTEALHQAMNQLLTELADTDALIVDVSLNSGGTDSISMELASHFADSVRVGFSKWPANEERYRNDRKVVPYTEQDKEGAMYLKPVYVMTSDFTASAAEIFTMCMRSFPNVTTVGKSTSGALSDILDKSLPNQWELGISNEVYVDHEGVCHEGPGIPPNVEMDIFDPEDVMNLSGHSQAIKRVLKLTQKSLGK
jgi:C-terminal processing protease CtpA/Prc